MFYNHFIATYIIFGTKLLTQCPVPVAVFCLFFTSQEINIKRSTNTAKLFGDFLWTRTPRMGQRSTWRCPEGVTTHQGATGGPGLPRWVVFTSRPSSRETNAKKSYKYRNHQK